MMLRNGDAVVTAEYCTRALYGAIINMQRMNFSPIRDRNLCELFKVRPGNHRGGGGARRRAALRMAGGAAKGLYISVRKKRSEISVRVSGSHVTLQCTALGRGG